ncbi:VOC family protein [Brevundimonas bacteroides]|uniref:VOC family protein n=1 Tax=Brevundimonas bacteroides TaxID=74311 RepID=UPI00049720EF|nr:VOC family protein [Brevundimonas bacteroides]
MPVSSLIRSAVFCSDLERSTVFYRALGLDAVYFEGDLDPESSQGALQVPAGSTLRCRILKRSADAANFGMVGLFELTPAPEPLPAPAGPPRLGETALVFYAQPFIEVLTAARGAGATWSPDPITFVMPHRSQMEVCLRDPDGVLINLIDRDPAEQFKTVPVGG